MSINERLRELARIEVFKDVADAFIGRPSYFAGQLHVAA